MKTAYITHSDCLHHNMGHGHPECPQRLPAIQDALYSLKCFDFLDQQTALLGKEEHVLLAHTPEYLQFLKDHVPKSGLFEIDPDTRMNPFTLKAAFRAVGAVVQGVNLILSEEVDNAFCAVRPPGHHAESGRAMGFCFFNNIAIAALSALSNKEINRVAILDFDVHHGNGTEEILHANERVMICSTFQSPFYPGNEFERANSRIINVPLKSGAGSIEFRSAITDQWVPAIRTFQPDFIFISAGFDAHRNDPLADLQLTEGDYLWVTREILKVANEFSRGRVLSALEGGYHLPSLGKSAAIHIKALMGLADHV